MLEIIIGTAIGCVSFGICSVWAYKLRKEKKNMLEDEQSFIDEITGRIETIDKEVNDAIARLHEMNSVVFDCPCSHNTIRTFIDLSKTENTFICPECKNEYRIDITMVPILKGKIVDERNMYKLLSSKFELAKNDKAE